MMRSLILAATLALVPAFVHAAPVPVLKATAAPTPSLDPTAYGALLVIDIASGKTLYQSQATRSWTPASLTKLMTVVSFAATPRNWNANGTITSADEVGGGRLGVQSGSRMTLRDLLYSAIVGSANNAAEALARQSGIGRDAFIKRMNEDAQALGLTNSVFQEASGMEATNKTTAYDTAILLNKAAAHPEIQKAMVTVNYPFTIASPTRVSKNVKNTNGLLFIEPDLWVTAGKTGYLEESQYNLAVQVKPSPTLANAQQVVNGAPAGEVAVIVFGAPTRDGAVQAAATLTKWAWDSYTWHGANTATFTKNRGLNDKGEDIRALQKYLNAHGTPVATSGAGSPGNETTLFGGLTKAALIRFQQAHAAHILEPQGRTAPTGYLDFHTRAFLNGAETSAATAAAVHAPQDAPVPPSTSTTPSLRFTQDLAPGKTHQDIRALQQYLNANGFPLATSGPGAPGQETAFFGALTHTALKAFQEAKSLEKTGILDAQTRQSIGN